MKDTILLIEDNEQNLYLATFLLEKNGFTRVQSRAVVLADGMRRDCDFYLRERGG